MKEVLNSLPTEDPKEVRRRDYLRRHRVSQDHGAAAGQNPSDYRAYMNWRNEWHDRERNQDLDRDAKDRITDAMVANAAIKGSLISDGGDYRIHESDLTPEQEIALEDIRAERMWDRIARGGHADLDTSRKHGGDIYDHEGYLTFSPGGSQEVAYAFDDESEKEKIVPVRSLDDNEDDSEEDEDTPKGYLSPYDRGLERYWEVDFALDKQLRKRARPDIIEKQYDGTTEEDMPDYVDGFSIKDRP